MLSPLGHAGKAAMPRCACTPRRHPHPGSDRLAWRTLAVSLIRLGAAQAAQMGERDTGIDRCCSIIACLLIDDACTY
jgi:hypothetical protein